MKLKHFFIDADLTANAILSCPPELWHRLIKVLRLQTGAEIAVFNGRDGLFQASVGDAKILNVGEQIKSQPANNGGVTLLFAMVKKPALDNILRQATECGVVAIQPVLSEFSVVDKLNLTRAEKIVSEAAEQCERLTVPNVLEPKKLASVLSDYQHIYWANEVVAGQPNWPNKVASDAAILVGPEGGFSEAERTQLATQSHITSVALADNILRADTAVTAVLSQYWLQTKS